MLAVSGALLAALAWSGHAAAGIHDRNVHLLADTLHLDASTVTRQIAALEDSGLVERRPDPQDRRSSTIELTPRGRQTMEGVERVRRERMEALVRHWSEEERVTLGSTLHRLNVALLEYGGMSDGLRETLSYGCPGT